ncbi:hypothetical protein BDN72DRAFT_948610 [Pluteus cervinus]|uniref:Uncharacterized protein n=1 Tax=Pluteus cervinus TaxID=181527 RepID=A0ACD3A052_9AGAR|nr:hypothetical protein BDN72DRAFT_948610 [Pluteus cervinus]
MASNPNPSPSKTECKHRRYYEGNKEELREKSRLRMAKLRAERRALTSTQAGLASIVVALNSDQDETSTQDSSTEMESNPQTDDALEDEWDSEAGMNTRPFNESPDPDSNGSAVGVDDDELERIRLTPFDEMDHFNAASNAVHTWLAEWGGLEAWSGHLDSGYETAKETGHIDQWIQKVLDHADRGRLLRNLLGQMETALPPELWKIRELWRQQTVLLGLVIKGLVLIEVRVDIIHKGPFNLIRK